MTMSYPKLLEKFGKEYTKKVILNPRCNMKERSHVILGELNVTTRQSYVSRWKRSLKQRVRPIRDDAITSFAQETDGSGMDLRVKPGSSVMDPKYTMLRQKVAQSLSKLRVPQLHEFFEVGDIIGSGREGTVRPGVPIELSKLLIPRSSLEDNIILNKENQHVEDNIFAKDFLNLGKQFQGKFAAIKTVNKNANLAKEAYREVQVLEKLCAKKHPNVLPYLYTFESPIRLHILTELCRGGDLFTYMADHDFEKIKEKEAAKVILQLLTAVQHCHESGYIHLDIKLENIMRRRQAEGLDEGGVVLIDFGHAAKVPTLKRSRLSGAEDDADMDQPPKGRLVRPVGSPSYASPETVLDKEFSTKSDVWSLGVVSYILLQGYLPYPHLQRKKWREFTIDDYGNFDGQHEDNDPFGYEGDWEDISSQGKDCVKKMLTVCSEKRASMEEVMNHPWFESQGFKVVRNEDNVPVVEEILMKDANTSRSWFGKHNTTDGGESKSYFSFF